MYPLFESIKVVEGQCVNLEWHQLRVNYARQKLMGSTDIIYLRDHIAIPEDFTSGVVKCKIPYGRLLGSPNFEFYQKKAINSLQLVETVPFSYQFKYMDRKLLQYLYQLRGPCDEILITHRGYLKDTSYSNVVLYDGNSWYTPQEPLLAGTQRAKLLSSGKIKNRKIHISELSKYQKLALINAMIEFDPDDFLPTTAISLWRGDPIKIEHLQSN